MSTERRGKRGTLLMRPERFSMTLTAVLAILAVTTFVAGQAAAQESVLYSFLGGGDGGYPRAGLIFDQAGNLYGTSLGGGIIANCCGTVFELTPNVGGVWTEKVLHNFTNGDDGGYPYAGLIFDAAGNLYGTTSEGGANKLGTVFELTPKTGGVWTEKVLHSFAGGKDGTDPAAGLIFDAAGNLYGTTAEGGEYRYGTAFELTPAAGGRWTEKILHNFGKDKDGNQPVAGLISDAAGNLYGTNIEGGAYGLGTVFELTPNVGGGWTEKVVHSFNGKDGGDPAGCLIFDAAGNLYGTTNSTAFELTPKAGGGWAEKILHTFNPYHRDGSFPAAGLIFDAAGNLYGTTSQGGDHTDKGTVFELTPAEGGRWTEKLLYNYAGLTLDGAGNLYGTTNWGGDRYCTREQHGCGVIFEITP
jgi:uncharacterized repeat protein (TIGR03803 family)